MSDELKQCGCSAVEPEPSPVENKPGLPAISYRPGTHPVFLNRLLEQIHRLKGSSATAAASLAALTTRSTTDPSIALLDAWAMLADVLTFYQERIANEGYLRTATERRSVLELTRAIGYELGPGVAASVALAFTVEEVLGSAPASPALMAPGPGNSPYNSGLVKIPKGTQAQSVPEPGGQPQTFETSQDFEANVEWNSLRPRLTRKPDLALSGGSLYLLGIEAEFSSNAGKKTLKTSDVYFLNPQTTIDSSVKSLSAVPIRELYFRGVTTNLKHGDRLLLLGERDGARQTAVFVVEETETDSDNNRTRVVIGRVVSLPLFLPVTPAATAPAAQQLAFTRANIEKYILQATVSETDLQAFLKTSGWDGARLAKAVNTPPAEPPAEYGAFAFRATANFFGHNAPLWASLPRGGNALRGDPYPSNWDAAGFTGPYIWTDSQGHALWGGEVLLERSFPQVLAGSWLHIEGRGETARTYFIRKTVERSVADYNMSGKATALSLTMDASERPVGLNPPAAIYRGSNRLDVFAIQSDGCLYHRWFDGQVWHGPENLGGENLVNSPSVVSRESSRLDVFAIAADRRLYHWSLDGEKWSGPEPLGGKTLQNSPAAVAPSADAMDVFAVGSDGRLYHFGWSGGKWNSQCLGGAGLRNSPAAVASAGVIHVVVTDEMFLQHFASIGPGYVGPLPVSILPGLAWRYAPAAVAYGSGLLVFVNAHDGHMYLAYHDGTIWSPFPNLPVDLGGHDFVNTPAVVLRSSVLVMLAISSDGYLYRKSMGLAGPSSSDFTNISGSGDLVGSPAAAVSGDRVDVLASSSFGEWRHAWAQGSEWHALESLGGPKVPDFHVRDATAYLQTELLDLEAVPIHDAVREGSTLLMLNLMVVGLMPDRQVALSGARFDARGVTETEILTLKDVQHVRGFTVLKFAEPLAHSYARESVRVNANVTTATHGATVQELLGDGDSSRRHLSFALKRPPLTHVPADTPSGAATTLSIEVDGVPWTEAATLYGLRPGSKSYEVRLDDNGTPAIHFGDPAARPRTGSRNVRATYRTGIGRAGNVDAGSISILMSRPPGLRGVTNPAPASGGASPQGLREARESAPLTALTLDRIVSLEDYENFCRAFAGVGKAQAVEVWNGSARFVHITIAAADGASVKPASPLYRTLQRAVLRAHDPVQQFALSGYQPLPFHLAASVLVGRGHDADEVLAEARTALWRAFSFHSRAFAQPVTAAEIITVIQSVPGVQASNLSKLYVAGDPAGPNQTEAPAFLRAEPTRWLKNAIQPAQLLLFTRRSATLTEMPR